MELWQLWLISTADAWGSFLDIISTITVIGGIISAVIFLFTAAASEEEGDDPDRINKIFRVPMRWCTIAFLCSTLLNVLIPSQKSIWMMTGAYVVTNVEGINKLSANTVKALNNFLESYNPSTKAK